MGDNSYFVHFFKNTLNSIPKLNEKLLKPMNFKYELKEESKIQEIKSEASESPPFLNVIKQEIDDNQGEKLLNEDKKESEIYADMINSFSNFDIFGDDPKLELSKQIKRIKTDIYEKISHHINPDHLVNKLTFKIMKIQIKNYKHEHSGIFQNNYFS